MANRGKPSTVHTQAVDELERLLQLHSSCQHLLNLHNGLECLVDRINDLLRRCTLRNRGNLLTDPIASTSCTDSDDDDEDDYELEVDDDYLSGWKCDVPTSCGNIE